MRALSDVIISMVNILLCSNQFNNLLPKLAQHFKQVFFLKEKVKYSNKLF